SSRHRRSTLFPYPTLFRSVFEFPRRCLEILPTPSRNHLHVRCTDSLCSAAAIHCRVADPYNEHAWLDALYMAEVNIRQPLDTNIDRKSTRLNSSHVKISYA